MKSVLTVAATADRTASQNAVVEAALALRDALGGQVRIEARWHGIGIVVEPGDTFAQVSEAVRQYQHRVAQRGEE